MNAIRFNDTAEQRPRLLPARYVASVTETRFEKRWPLGNVGPTRIAVDSTLPALLLLLLATFRFRLFPFFESELPPGTYWAMATSMTFGVVGSMIVHELAHVRTSGASGRPPRGILLFLIGAAPQVDAELPGRWIRAWIHLSGTLASLGLAALLLALYLIGAELALPRSVAVVFFHLAAANVTLAVFQLLPALPLDGGRALLALLSRNGRSRPGIEYALYGSGVVLALAFVGMGIAAATKEYPVLGAWLCLVGIILGKGNLLEHDYLRTARYVAGRPVRDFMNAAPVIAPVAMGVDYFAALCRRHDRYAVFPAVDGDRLVGLVRPASVYRYFPGEWRQHKVSELLEPASRENTVSPDEDAGAVLASMLQAGTPRRIVADGERLVGILSYGLLWDAARRGRRAQARRPSHAPVQ